MTYAIESITRSVIILWQLNKFMGGTYNLLAHTLTNYGVNTTFVDSDDIVSCKYIETLYSLIKNNNADISICNCVHCFDDTDIQFSMSTYLEVLDSDSAINNLLYQKKFLVFCLEQNV